MKRKTEILLSVFKKCRFAFLTYIISFFVCGGVFYLYRLTLEPFLYAALLIGFFQIILFIITYTKELKGAKERELMIRSAMGDISLPNCNNITEKDYTKVILLLKKELAEISNKYESAKQEEIDYYTAWAHQIKTPISVMRMELGNSDTENFRRLNAELFRIEQYVDMVLTYIRLGGVNDLVIKEYPLDELIRETVRKYAPQFVSKRLQLLYGGTTAIIITDKKWFTVILEQIISNAIKYTSKGSIEINLIDGILNIKDTGIGIAKEDIPRIFEKGFTGANGRLEKRSSGLGLYLCKKSADLLNIPLAVESTVGKGSTFLLDLKEKSQQ